MKTRTFVISKTKVNEVKYAIERDCDAEIWVHLCDGFVRVQVDNVHGTALTMVTVESPYKERPAGDDSFESFNFRATQFSSDWWSNVDGAVKVQAVSHGDHKKNEIILKARQHEEATR